VLVAVTALTAAAGSLLVFNDADADQVFVLTKVISQATWPPTGPGEPE
jgi:hypothetical protein